LEEIVTNRFVVGPQESIQVRWGLHVDEAQIAELLELNTFPRWAAFEDRFIVAERDGRVLAALQYRTESKLLLLGLLVSDPWVAERPLATALYAGAGELALEMGAREVRVRSVPHADDYPYEAGYCRRYPVGWHLPAMLPLQHRRELPEGGWQRMIALLGIPAVSFFRTFRENGRWKAGPR
jgi:hypothetical protein